VSGKHLVGIIVPSKRSTVVQEVVVPPGRLPRRVVFKD
jgi:hypothetical protein